MSGLPALTFVLATFASTDEPPPGTPVADRVIFRDRTWIVGQVEGLNPRGELVVVARRSWVEANQPERARSWASLEANTVATARLERRRRLEAWRRLRAANAPPGDLVLPWIDREIRAMSDSRPPSTYLMRVPISPSEIASVVRRDPESARLLRLGWLDGLEGIEDTEPKPLREQFEARGLLRPGDPAWVDSLLPIKSEPEAQWRTRRAVTEALTESDLRFVQFRDFILPEMGAEPDFGKVANGAVIPEGPGAVADRTALLDTSNALTAFRSINSVSIFDAVRSRLALVGNRGRIGAIVSKVDWPSDFDSVSAETALWVRQESGSWSPVVSRRLTLRAGDPVDPLSQGPIKVSFPIRTAVHVLELFAASASLPETSRERQEAAAMAQRALGLVRADLDRAIRPYVLPIAPGGF